MSDQYAGEVGGRVMASASGTHPMMIMSYMLKCVLVLLLFVTAVLPYFLDEKTNPAMLALLVSALVLVLYHKTLVEERLLLARSANDYGDGQSPSVVLPLSVALFAVTVVLQMMSMTIRQQQQCDGEEELGDRYTAISVVNCVLLFLALVLVAKFDHSYTS